MNDLTRLQMIFGKSGYHRSMRKELLGNSLRLLIKKAVFGKKPGVDTVLGFKVAHFSLKTLTQLFDEIFISGIYRFTADTPRPNIIDCGGNIGMSVLFFKKFYPDSTITVFEPDRETFATLEKNVALNNLENVTLHNKAVGDLDGTLYFYSDPHLAGSLLMSTCEEMIPNGKRVEVESVRLSRFINGPVDLLKLDVEGAEQQVIEDLKETGTIRFVKQIFIEYHHHLRSGPDCFSRILADLETSGFRYQLYSNYQIPFGRDQIQNVIVYAYRP
jgi:FkbM family methyltransferase